MSKYKSKSKGPFFSVLLTSCVMWSGALDSSDVLLSYSIIIIASHITTILITDIDPLNISINSSVECKAKVGGSGGERAIRKGINRNDSCWYCST